MTYFVITIFYFNCNYNRSSSEVKADFFADSNLLVELIKSDEKIDNVQSMLKISQRRYTWDIVRIQYFDTMKIS